MYAYLAPVVGNDSSVYRLSLDSLFSKSFNATSDYNRIT